MNRKFGLAGGIVLLVGISACLWLTRSSGEADTQIVHAMESFSCSQCGNQFAMTAEKAKRHLQSGQQAYICPACNESDALGNRTLPAADKGSTDAKQEKKRPRVGIGRQPVQP